MRERNEHFPSGLEAVFLVVGLFAAEYLVAAALTDASRISGLHARDLDGLVVLFGNAVVFVALMHYKQLTWRNLFHPSRNSVGATMATLSVPILLVVPALLLAMWAVLSALVAVVPMSRWEEAMFERMMSNTVASIVAVCVLAPVLEEMFFRGIVLRSFLHQYSRRTAILGSAALFGLAHMNVYQFVVGLALGIIAGWLYERARSLWPCILLHAAYNTSLTALSMLSAADRGLDVGDLSLPAWVAAFVLAFVGATLMQRILGPREARGEMLERRR